MKKIFLTLILTLFYTKAFAADSWKFLPGLEEGFEWKPTLSLVIGQIDFADQSLDDGSQQGVELGFTCPTLAAPGGDIRQHLTYSTFSKNNSTLTFVELTPKYYRPINENLKWGVGLGLGYLSTDVPPISGSNFSYNLALAIEGNWDRVFAGLDVRIGDTDSWITTYKEMASTRYLLRLGYNFY